MPSSPDSISAMFWHGGRFFWRILLTYTDSIGDTILGYFAPALVMALAFVITYRGNSRKRSVIVKAIKDAIKEHGNAWLLAFVMVYGLIFLYGTIREVWEDHQEKIALTMITHELKVQLERRRHSIITTDPVFPNIIYMLQAFHIYRTVRHGGPCVLKVTAPRGPGADLASMMAQFSNSVTGCFTFGPLMTFDQNPELEIEATDGMVPDAIVFHADKDDKAAEQLFINLGNQIKLIRSYKPPTRDFQVPTPEARVIWLQFGTDPKWNSERN